MARPLLALVLFAALAGSVAAAPAPPAASLPASMTAISVGEMPPFFLLTDLSGKPMTLSGQRGKVVLLVFAASWCGPCRKMSSALGRWNREYSGDRFTVLGINVSDKSDTAAKFVDEGSIGYPVALDLPGDVTAKSFGVTGMPAFFLMGEDGKVLWRYTGAFAGLRTEFSVEREIRKALQ